MYQIFGISTDVNDLFNNIYSHGKMFGYILLSENQNHNAYSPILEEKKEKVPSCPFSSCYLQF